jgi:hypothetical protein
MRLSAALSPEAGDRFICCRFMWTCRAENPGDREKKKEQALKKPAPLFMSPKYGIF